MNLIATLMAFAMIVIVALAGVQVLLTSRRKQPSAPQGQEGWVYFVTAPEQDDAPVMVGSTHRDLRKERAELEESSPFPLKVVYKFRASNCLRTEEHIHELFKEYRLHGEWFDRDVTMAFIDDLKERAG